MKNKEKTNIKIIETRKYKDINLYLRFSIENRPYVSEMFALLIKLIGDVSIKYPNKVEMAKARDMLYGISLDVTNKFRANISTLGLHYSFINPRFVDTSIDEYVDYIKETLFNSLINDKTLKEAKKNVIASLKRSLDKPNAYASQRFAQIVSKDNPDFSVFNHNLQFIKRVNGITLKQIQDFYDYLINKAQLNIYLCGDIDEKTRLALTDFNFKNRIKVKYQPKKVEYKPKKMIVDKKDIGQSVLYSVYSTPFNKHSKDFFAWFVGNVFLGVVPTSLLFEEVREKLSLCYSIGVIDYKNDGLVRIATFIEDSNAKTVLNQINIQINRIIKQDYDFNKLEMSKLLLCDTLMSSYDDLDALVDYYYESLLANFNYSLEDYVEQIMKVNANDLTRVFKKYNHYFDYELKGTANEKKL